MKLTRAAFDRATLAFIALLAVVTAARIGVLYANPLDLYVDEAQYWSWSRALDWGYFTKPPLVAWTIAATTALFGDAEWAVRLGAPLAHAATAAVLFALGRALFGAWPGFWAGLGWLALPGIFFSSVIISTDAVLLPLWSFSLFGAWRLIETRAMGWAVAIGLALGLGVLAKYAMLYFVLCTAAAAWWLPPLRAALGQGRGLGAGAVAAAIVAPNLIWNLQNGFATARHTAANARFDSGDMFNLDELGEFVGGQAGVLGPVIFLALSWALWRAARRPGGLSDQDKFCIAYILPPFLVVSAIAYVSRANANWAAVAYPAILVWLTGLLFVSRTGRRLLATAIAVNVAIGLSFATVAVSAPQLANRFKGVRTAQAWEETAREIAQRAVARAGETPFTAVMVDDRATFYALNYYWREARRDGVPLPPVRMWLLRGEAHTSAEATDPMRTEEGGRVLVVHLRQDYLPFVAGDFTVFRAVEHLAVPLGGGVNREIEISVGEGFAPVERTEEFEARLSGD